MNSIVLHECKCPACGCALRRELQEEKDAVAKEKARLLANKVRVPPHLFRCASLQPTPAVTTSKANKKNLPEISGSSWIQTSGKGNGSGVRKMFKVSMRKKLTKLAGDD